jgi:tol-pal system protein YbgF
MPTAPAFALIALVALLALPTMGCAHTDSVADRHVSEMRETITKIEAEQDRENQRSGLLEVGPHDEKTPGSSSPKAKPTGTSTQRSVQIGDGDDGRDDDPNDPNARPEIRLQGQPGTAPRAPRGKPGSARINTPDRDRDRDRTTDDSLRTDGPRSSALDPEAKKAYEAALGQINAKQYDRGIEALNAFLVRWPDHPYVENAMYWRGEGHYARGEYLRAAEQFEAVLARFSSGSKSPDALLKIGMCHERLGASERAKEYWDRLKREYPRSDAAKKIPNERSSNDRPATGPVGPR